MPDLDYYKPFTGADGVERKPLVERVEACRPILEWPKGCVNCRLVLHVNGEYYWRYDVDALGQKLTSYEAAALTRQAVEDWARGLRCGDYKPDKWQTIYNTGIRLFLEEDHAACNAAAHALSDLLEVDDA